MVLNKVSLQVKSKETGLVQVWVVKIHNNFSYLFIIKYYKIL